MDLNKIKIVLIGYGCMGQAVTPALISQLKVDPSQICIITADNEGSDIATAYGIEFHNQPIVASNLSFELSKYLKSGDLLLNLSVGVSSLALLDWCQKNYVFYLDTCVEPWAGGYFENTYSELSSNYYLRYQILNEYKSSNTTAVIAHGANPGLITHIAKRGLLKLAELKSVSSWDSWAHLSQSLGIKVIQIAERDTQSIKADFNYEQFGNTWSSIGFQSEAWQLAEAGWGTHENSHNARKFNRGDGAGVYFTNHGANVIVKSWVPSIGEGSGMMISHHESISIAELLTLKDDTGNSVYRPTVYFAYQPSPITCESVRRWRLNNFILPTTNYLLRDTLASGFDQLGVLFIFDGGSYWYGSTLSLEDARKLFPHNNATSLQVVAGILGALLWMQKNPNKGVVEAESMDSEEVMDAALPFLGDVSGFMTNWQPMDNGELKFEEFLICGL
jgi:homospermidine synthase